MRSWRVQSRLLGFLVTTVFAVAINLPRQLVLQHEHDGGERAHVHTSGSTPHSHVHSQPLPFAHNDDDLDLSEPRSGSGHRLGWGETRPADTHHTHWQQLFQPATVATTSFVVAVQPVDSVPPGGSLAGIACLPQRLRARAPPHSLLG